MGLEDNDVIDRALDAAEAKLAEREEVSSDAAPTDAPEVQVSESPSEAPKEAPARARDETGKFAKGEKASKKAAPVKAAEPEQISSDQDATAEQADETQQGAEAAPQEQSIVELPAFWSAEEKAAVAKAPREVQQIIARKEAQRNEWANRMASEAEGSRATLKQLDEAYQPYRAKLQANGVPNVVEANRRLLAWNDMFENDLVGTVNALLAKNGLTPHHLIEDAQQNPVPQSDPRVEEAIAKADAAEKQLREFQESQTRSSAEQELNAFRAGKDSTGNVRAPFVDAYQPQIGQALAAMRQQYPQLSRADALHHAYEFTLQQVRALHGLNGTPTQAAPKQAPQQVAKAKAAASSVTGAPANGKGSSVRPRAKTIDEALDRAEEQLGLR